MTVVSSHPIKGEHSWLILFLVVAVLDLLARDQQTLSHATQRSMEKHPFFTTAVVVVTSVHLVFGHTRHYSRVDPFRAVGYLRKFTV